MSREGETPSSQMPTRHARTRSGEFDLVSGRLDDLRTQIRDLTKELRAFMEHARDQESDNIRAIERCATHGVMIRDETNRREEQIIALHNRLNQMKDEVPSERSLRTMIKGFIPVDATRKSRMDWVAFFSALFGGLGTLIGAIYALFHRASP